MRNILACLALLIVPAAARAQVTLHVNLPQKLGVGETKTFQVKISKGDIQSYSKLEITLPKGVEITQKETNGGTFSFSDNRVKIIWPITPQPADLITEMNFTARDTGTFPVALNYYYLENADKHETESEPYIINVTGSPVTEEETAFIELKTFTPSSLEIPVSKNVNMNSEDPGEIRMQAYQLRKDSKDALKTGEIAKKKASENLEDATTILRQAEYLDDQELRAMIIKQATPAKTRAELDIEIANKILTLAKTLENDANALEKKILARGNVKPLEKPAQNSDTQTTKGIVYRVQVGAFGKNPPRSEFNSLGKVDIINESGLYKVMIGKYNSRQDALSKREQLVNKGVDAFVVSYQDGVRVK
jgi:cell division protein FtsN